MRRIPLICIVLVLWASSAAAADEPNWRYDLELVHNAGDSDHPWRMRVTDSSSSSKALGYASPELNCYVNSTTQEFEAHIPLAQNVRRMNYAVAWYTDGQLTSQPKQIVCRDSLEDHTLIVRFDVPQTTDTRYFFRLFLRAQIGPGLEFRNSSAGWTEPERVVLFLSPRAVFNWVRIVSDRLAQDNNAATAIPDV